MDTSQATKCQNYTQKRMFLYNQIKDRQPCYITFAVLQLPIKSINNWEIDKAVTYLAHVLTEDLIQPGCTPEVFLLLFLVSTS